MEPSSESTNWSLPQPSSAEQRPVVESTGMPVEKPIETQSGPATEHAPMSLTPQFPLPQAFTQSQPATDDNVTAPPPTDNSALSDDLVAADSDRIEKEWVDKAKKIVEQARQDPYLQTQGFTELKASYLQKRYGKTLKASE